MSVPPLGRSRRFVFSAAGFIATSTSGASPGVRMSWSAKWSWKPETPGSEPAGARISAGKSGSVERSLPTSAVSFVNCPPVSCIPSPESPAKRIVTCSSCSTCLAIGLHGSADHGDSPGLSGREERGGIDLVPPAEEVDVSKREAERSKNMFALGLMSWLYHRPTDETVAFLERKFRAKPAIAEANVKAFKAGWAYGETSEDFVVSYEVAPAKMPPGTYRNITGNQALALGLVAASVKSGLELFLGAYPITPASGILEDLSRHKRFGIRTFQAEDEIAAVGAALGASFGGALGVCTSSGPGVALKSE